MKRFWFLALLAALGLAACGPGGAPAAPTPTAALATVPASLPTTLAAYRLPDAATATASPSPTPQPRAPYPGPVGTLSVAQLPPAPIIGIHTVQPGDTVFCIGRAYGVLPAAIAQANGLAPNLFILAGQLLNIPAVQWADIPEGPVCRPQFQSPFPGLVVPTPTGAASSTPSGPPLTLSVQVDCIANCGSKDGAYELQLVLAASGGAAPYQYLPAKTFDVTVPHCSNGQGMVVVTAADGQTAKSGWAYQDVACP